MKIILLKDVKNIGKKMDIKNVPDGYAKNYLLPNNLAKIATDSLIKEVIQKKEISFEQEKKLNEILKDIAKKFSDKDFHFYPDTGENDAVYSSVTKEQIKEAFLRELKNNDREKIENLIKIELPKSLRQLGEHKVGVNFGKNIKFNIKVVLNQSTV